MALEIRCEKFDDDQPIPPLFTCEGEDMSPPLRWQGAPDGVESYVLICDDPDAPGGIFTHWVLFNIPPGTDSLPRQMPADKKLDGGAIQGKNDFDAVGYRGPCPPPGDAHHYHFHLFALDSKLGLGSDATRDDVLAAMEDHVLAEALLTGTFRRDK